MPKQPQQNNPYSSAAGAAGAYGEHAKQNASNPREVEARALLKSAQHLQALYDGWNEFSEDRQLVEDALRYNRTIWMMFYDTALEDKDGDRPSDLRSNIINLANFIFKRTVEIQSDAGKDREKLTVLININREIASGLLQQVEGEEAASAKAPAPQQYRDSDEEQKREHRSTTISA